MYIGLDVGGTNTDAVLLNARYDVVESCKVPTTHEDVGTGIISALQRLLSGQNPQSINRVCVSSTLALNALLTKRYDPTGLVLIPGPGLTAPPQWQNPLVQILSGAQDHLGTVIAKPKEREVMEAFKNLQKQGIKALGIVTKFSPKNPALEEWLKEQAQKVFPADMPLVLGNSLSGTLNFPRRVATAWCQAALTAINTQFIAKLEKAMRDLDLHCPLDILKADGGTFAHTIAANNPANSIGSGPAASILGALPEASGHLDCAVISIGGTTTDLAILAAGEPLMLKEGLTIDNRATLIKGMHTKSIALGGDSSLAYEQGTLIIKPERLGPAICLTPQDLGKRPPTLTDALRVVGRHELGEMDVARESLAPLAQSADCGIDEIASLAVQTALEILTTTLADFVEELNSQPVYTIREIQYTEPITPHEVILIGAPAPAFARPLEHVLGLPLFAPDNAGISNAIGAALARPTVDAELYADTGTGLMSIAPFGITKHISKRYNMKEAQEDLAKALMDALQATYEQYEQSHIPGTEDDSLIQIVFAETFHTLSGYSDRGKIFRVKAQVSPGIISTQRETS